MARHDSVQHSVTQQKFSRLKTFGQLLVGSLLDYAASSEANHGAWLRQVQIAQAGERSGDAAGSWIAQHRQIWNPRIAQPREGRCNFSHLHQREDAFLHPRPARGTEANHRQAAP